MKFEVLVCMYLLLLCIQFEFVFVFMSFYSIDPPLKFNENKLLNFQLRWILLNLSGKLHYQYFCVPIRV